MERVVVGFIGIFFLIAAGQLRAEGTSERTDISERPNILLIIAEDMSSHIGAFGDSLANTPNIDQLAAQGIRYTNAFTVSGVCAPSRAALITGVHSITLGAHHMRTTNRRPIEGLINYETVPPAEVKAFPELLRRAGYATANLAKTDYQFGEPFTIWDFYEPEAFPEDLALWRHLPKAKPFFVMLNMMVTHESFLTPPIKPGKHVENPVLRGIAQLRARIVTPVTKVEDVTVPPYLPDTVPVRESIAQHYDNIHHMDQQVGQVLAALKEDGLADNTIIIWTTDHGDGFPRAKRSVYDSGLKVPLVIYVPHEVEKGILKSELVSFVDIAPTILALSGVNIPDYIQGKNFLSGNPRQYVYAARDRMDGVHDRVRAVRDKRYKYIRNYQAENAYFYKPLPFREMFPVMKELWAMKKDNSLTSVQNFYFTAPRPTEELYDTQQDPHEVNNLAGDKAYSEELQRLRKAMDEWLNRVTDWGNDAEMDMVASMWPGLKQPLTAAPVVTIKQYNDRVIISLSSATEGASIGYRMIDARGKEGDWEVYTKPITLTVSQSLDAKAIRYGYRESSVTTEHIQIHPDR